MKLNLLNALIATAVLFVMASFLMGMQLSPTAPSWWCTARRKYAGCGSASVASSSFLPAVAPAAAAGIEKVSGPALVLPSFDGTTPRQKLLAALLIVAAVARPFWSRAARWISPP